ncbi:calcium-binding protein [Geitlerinema sp. PCC 7407]|uniref:beta strand repeat-containing protein n=1 Tax=Geitlerinema sp. PCC 7407 TaxID=1173025 RepID=UPI00029FEAD1|nr:calcium-binding protein [Geitlerinema sp. PCC 7407]AFY67348.1 Hemolysin-type calcium-binding region [Geitlerinema sp. PCC 7407]
MAGTFGNDTLFGTNNNDILEGFGGNDLLYGLGGNDVLYGDGDNDDLYGGSGDDTLYGSFGADYLSGGSGNDALSGGSENDLLDGWDGNDWLDGGTGADTMYGGLGNDTYVVENAGDRPLEAANAGTDTVRASINYTLGDHLENLTLLGAATLGIGNSLSNVLLGNNLNNVFYGQAGNDFLLGLEGNDVLDGGVGADSMYGGVGDDVYIVDNVGDGVFENPGQGTDTVRSLVNYSLTSNVEHLELYSTATSGIGNDLNNIIIGNSANNVLQGLAGNDILNGGVGADSMYGGLGNDSYIVDNAGDRVFEGLGQGTDTVRAFVNYTLGDHLENLLLVGTAAIAQGNSLNNLLNGNATNNRLSGLGGNDILVALDGNDVLDGGVGADSMYGGVGDDFYIVDNVGDRVFEGLGQGTDTVRAFINYTLEANVENLELYAPASNGLGNDLNNRITGNALNNILSGLAGNDLLYGLAGDDALNGGLGADFMDGGLGNDTYTVDNAGDRVIEAIGSGTDTVRSSINYALADNVENLTLLDTALVGTGNALNNYIFGHNGNNTLRGLAGNDWFSALGGNDFIDGGLGADTMYGGLGNDIYVVDNLGDRPLESANAGTDTVYAYLNYALGNHLENLVLYGSAIIGDGNTLNNRIVGNALNNTLRGFVGNDTIFGEGGNDFIDGGLGTDILYGGLGNDLYYVDNVGDRVVESLNSGTDTVRASINHVLAANVENLVLYGTAALGSGNTLNNSITGSDLNNTLRGLGGNDTLRALAGNDTLDGGLGIDTMFGGLGNDFYFVDTVGDRVLELLDGGTDTVRAFINYTLETHVENLQLHGTATVGNGNALNNIITGNAFNNTLRGYDGADILFGDSGNDILEGSIGNDTLSGGLGSDTLIGGADNDLYIVDDVGDRVVEALGQGTTDTVRASINYTLGSNVENLELTGAIATLGNGNDLSNRIVGNALNNTLQGLGGNDSLFGLAGNDTLNGGLGNDTLDGGLGADSLIGGAGDDLYYLDNDGDVVVEAADAGNDTVRSTVNHSLSSNVENLILIGTTATLGSGNALNNSITGNLRDNTLRGFAGRDTLDGGDGQDFLFGGLDNDWLTGGSGDDSLQGADETGAGVGELDRLTGGAGSDRFYLGNIGVKYYDDGSSADEFDTTDTDYAIVADFEFSGTDKIQLQGVATDYTLKTLGPGTGLYLERGSNDELVAILDNVSITNLDLTNSNQFVYV